MPKTSAKIRRALVAVPCLLLGIGLLVRAPATHVLAQAAAPSGGQGRGQYTAVDGKVLPTAETLPQDMEHQGDYKLPFGADPYLPSEAKAEFPGFLQPADFPSAAYCGHCHADVHAQWRQSAHANSFRTPWYLKNVKELADSKGVAYTRHCEGCHNPVALFTGALTEGSTVARPHDEDGITCMVCHSIREVQSTKGIGSYVMGKPAVMIDGSGKPVAGLPSDQQILAHLDWHKQAVMRPIYHTSEYCAVCHKAAIPKMLNDYKWLRTFSTYDEWQQSSWSRETPLTFYKKPATSTCQTCHMQREATSDAASHGKPVASHRWLGANTAVAAYYGFDEQAKRLVDFLRDDQLEVDIFGITVERDPAAGNERFTPGSLIAPLGNKGFTVLPGDCVRVDVVVRNKGIGHTLVPELRDFYESWVDFEAKDDAGRTIYRSGAVDQNHSVDPDAHSYTLRIVSRDGTSLDHHEVWKTYVKAYDATISPGRADIVRYRFRIPNDAKGVSITASVRYRRADLPGQPGRGCFHNRRASRLRLAPLELKRSIRPRDGIAGQGVRGQVPHLRPAVFEPLIQFRDQRVDGCATRPGHPPNRKPPLLFPALDGAYVAANIPADLLPAVEDVLPDLTHGDLLHSRQRRIYETGPQCSEFSPTLDSFTGLPGLESRDYSSYTTIL